MTSKIIIGLWTLFCLYGMIAGQIDINQVPITTLAIKTGLQIGAWLAILMWLFVWSMVVTPVALIGLLFKAHEKNATSNVKSKPNRGLADPYLSPAKSQ